jgi:hypothetical protein
MDDFAAFLCCNSRGGVFYSGGREQKERTSRSGFNTPTRIDTNKSKTCGVGINFQSDKTGALVVSSLVPEGEEP